MRPRGALWMGGSVVVLAAASIMAASGRRPDDRGPAPMAADAAPQHFDTDAPYDGLYHFVRLQYQPTRGRGFGRFGGREPMWAHDYPRAERNFLQIIEEMTFAGTQTEGSNVFTLDDPDLFQFPIAYIVEVNYWEPDDDEIEALGDYLLKGGFLIVDDFRGYDGLRNLAFQVDRAMPGHQLIPIDGTHDVFDSFFRIDPDDVIPPYGGRPPEWYGVFEDNDPTKRMMVVVNYENDIAEYWEYSDRGYYPIDLSNEAYKLGVNYVVYGLTH